RDLPSFPTRRSSDLIERLAIDDRNGLAAADIEELLRRIGGERQVARKRGLGSDQLLHELAVAGEHLHAPVLAIRKIDHSVVGDADGMCNIEMRGSLGVRKGLWRHDCAAVLAAWRLAECTPHLLERAGIRIEDDHPVI